ncbi:MAG: alcohol dehydrogenase catalytic domain-containing protein [Erysipelothrix sp.]|nr:alcohol dehydrogenase catalytic domain-containing protein [Erysipelothrix sp.]
MRTILITDKREIQIEKFTTPKVHNDKILIRTDACAICTWEQRVYTGTHKVEYPVIAGHEVSGEIVALGKYVNSDEWAIGDKVVVGVTLPCRNCYFCKNNQEQYCRTFDGLKLLPGQPHKGTAGFSEYMMAPPNSVFKYKNVTPVEASLSEPLSCVINSVEAADPQLGEVSVIIGAGTMGLLHLLVCMNKGNACIVIDYNEERLLFAKSLGAKVVINPDKEDAKQVVELYTDGLMANNVFDTTPIASVVEDSCQYLANAGKLVIYSGIYPNEPVKLDAHWIHKKGISILGAANSNDTQFLKAVSLISNGIIDVKPLISGVYSISQAKEAMESACMGDKYRNVIVFNKEAGESYVTNTK